MKNGVLDSTITRGIAVAGVLAAFLLVLAAPVFADSQKGGRHDAQVNRDVRARLSEKAEFKNVSAKVDDGIVTLEGMVKLYIEKSNAEKRARKVANVAGVRNWIQVENAGISDAELSDRLARKLRYDRIGQGIMFNNFSLRVEDGAVTIVGNVRDYPDRDSALAILATTPGVRDVIDEIDVAPASGFDDDLRMRTAVAIYGYPTLTKYAVDPMAPIRIIVEGGHVTLHGAVDTEADRRNALLQAKSVPGAFSVTDKLLVAESMVR